MSIKSAFFALMVFVGAVAVAQTRESVRIFVQPSNNSEQERNLRERFEEEIKSNGHSIAYRTSADYMLDLTVKPNMVLYDDGTMEQAPPGDKQFVLQTDLLRLRDNAEIASFSFPFTNLDEIDHRYLIYRIMANLTPESATASNSTDANGLASTANPSPNQEEIDTVPLASRDRGKEPASRNENVIYPTFPAPTGRGERPTPKDEDVIYPMLPAPGYQAQPAPVPQVQPSLPAPGYQAQPAPVPQIQPSLPAPGYQAQPAPVPQVQPSLPAPVYQAQPGPTMTYQPQPAAPVVEVFVFPGLPDPSTNKVYRLQVGAFSAKESADRTSRLVASLGFQVIQELTDSVYRVLAIDVPALLVLSAAQRLGAAGIKEVWVKE